MRLVALMINGYHPFNALVEYEHSSLAASRHRGKGAEVTS